MTVSNEGTSATRILVDVRAIPGGTPEVSSVDWVQAGPVEFPLAPGEKQEVELNITVPGDVQPGGRYASIFVRNAPINVGGSGAAGFFGASGLGAEIGAKLILTVRGPGLRLEGQMTRIVPLALGPSALGFRAEITNTGNVHMVISGDIELLDASGNVLGRSSLPQTTSILPGATQSFKFRGALEVPPGDYHAVGTIVYGWTEQQSTAAQVDPDDWGRRTASTELSFNSVPRLRVPKLEMTAIEGGVEFSLELENYGDVEIVPAGVIHVNTKDGQRLIALNVPAGSLVIEPRTTVPTQKAFNGAIPQGEYDVGAAFFYHGGESAEATATAVVQQDVQPAVVPEAVEFRSAEEPAADENSLFLIGVWVALGGAVGFVVALGALFVGTRILGLSRPQEP